MNYFIHALIKTLLLNIFGNSVKNNKEKKELNEKPFMNLKQTWK